MGGHSVSGSGEISAFEAVKFDALARATLNSSSPSDEATGTNVAGATVSPKINIRGISIGVIRNEFGHNALAAIFIYVFGKLAGCFYSPEKLNTDRGSRDTAANIAQFLLDHQTLELANTVIRLFDDATGALKDMNGLITEHALVQQKDSAYTLDDLPDLIGQLELAVGEPNQKNNKQYFEKALKKAKDAMEKINQISEIGALHKEVVLHSLSRATVMVFAEAKTKALSGRMQLKIEELPDLEGDVISKAFQAYKEKYNIKEVNGRLQTPKEWYIRETVKDFQRLEQLRAQMMTLNGIVRNLGSETVAKQLENLDTQMDALYRELPPEGQKILAGLEEGDLTINDLYDIQTALTKIGEKFGEKLPSEALDLLADLKKQTDDMINIRESSEKITAKMQLLTDADYESFQNKIENFRRNRSTKAPTPE
ncbi:MAG: hypothetical protein LBD33_03480 [Puniceicoccales bacterium]|jgi:hypothetical protein|nr:hypothetical protein [Puniceicoccales bacterium]